VRLMLFKCGSSAQMKVVSEQQRDAKLSAGNCFETKSRTNLAKMFPLPPKNMTRNHPSYFEFAIWGIQVAHNR
jgi:hypothetical protein